MPFTFHWNLEFRYLAKHGRRDSFDLKAFLFQQPIPSFVFFCFVLVKNMLDLKETHLRTFGSSQHFSPAPYPKPLPGPGLQLLFPYFLLPIKKKKMWLHTLFISQSLHLLFCSSLTLPPLSPLVVSFISTINPSQPYLGVATSLFFIN